ncbi:GroES-like protein [Xylariaceae sp. FL0016]|nr:GroES-like protein [Xylariaceae sp. FL0016]
MSQRMHDALVTVAPRAPYEVHRFPTTNPKDDEILVSVKWTASTPLDLHQADGGLLVEHPMRTGSTCAGVVVQIGRKVTHFQVGDKVFGFAHQKPAWKAHQEYATAPECVFGKIPRDLSFEAVVTVPDILVTAFNTIWADLGLPTPWPKPIDYQPPRANDRILIWGAASSVGQHTIEVLRFYGYGNIVATASPKHHEHLMGLGATQCFDYRDSNVVDNLLRTCEKSPAPVFPLIVDCIGSQIGSLEPISKMAQSGSTVAVMLPVIVKHATTVDAPEYSMDPDKCNRWTSGVNVRGVRTHFYWKNTIFKEKLQTEIMPKLLADGVVKPLKYEVIEGDTLLERGTNALNALRAGVSGQRLVWRVSDY